MARMSSKRPSRELKQDTPAQSAPQSNQKPETEQDGYLTGFKLYLLVCAVGLIVFSSMLNGSIVGTVSVRANRIVLRTIFSSQSLGYSKDNFRVPLCQRCGMVWKRVLYREVSANEATPAHCAQFTDENPFSCALLPLTGKIYTHFPLKV